MFLSKKCFGVSNAVSSVQEWLQLYAADRIYKKLKSTTAPCKVALKNTIHIITINALAKQNI